MQWYGLCARQETNMNLWKQRWILKRIKKEVNLSTISDKIFLTKSTKAHRLWSEICRIPRNWIRCTHPRTIKDHHNAFIWGLRRAVLKFDSRKVGRKFFPRSPTRLMGLLTPQGNALFWSQFVLAWVQQIPIFGSSDRRLTRKITYSTFTCIFVFPYN